MATFTAGTSFTDGVTGDVTAAKLNALVADATPLANFITDRTAETSLATDDLVLISDTSDSGALNKMTVANFTNVVSTGTGTAASPAIRPTGDTNTGVFFPAADTAAISTAGSERLLIDSSGNVGIGTSSPTVLLDLGTQGSKQGYLRLRSTGSGSREANIYSPSAGGLTIDTNSYSFPISMLGSEILLSTGASGTERLRIDSSGNVGVGTASPASKLDIRFPTNPSSDNGVGSNVLRIATSVSQGADIGGAIGLGGEGVGSVIFGQIAGRKENSNSSSNSGYLQFNTLDNSGTMYERLRIDSSGNVGVGASPHPNFRTTIKGDSSSVNSGVHFLTASNASAFELSEASNNTSDVQLWNYQNGYLRFATNNTERLRITSGGNVLVGTTSYDSNIIGAGLGADGLGYFTRNAVNIIANRKTTDGTILSIQQDNAEEGTISVSGTTVSFNGGHLARFSQLPSGQRDPAIKKGTVLSNLDEMCVWNDSEGNPLPNEQLNKVKISDVEGDSNVAGVFVNWDDDDQDNPFDLNMAMTGDMIIRIAQSVSVNRGDLLMSAGDGTAKPQGDDVVKSKTIAKVTSTHATCTYEDGSYCVPCVLMAC